MGGSAGNGEHYCAYPSPDASPRSLPETTMFPTTGFSGEVRQTNGLLLTGTSPSVSLPSSNARFCPTGPSLPPQGAPVPQFYGAQPPSPHSPHSPVAPPPPSYPPQGMPVMPAG